MSLPEVVSREQWREARRALLVKEKAFTRQRDALSTERRMLPMVRVEKDYVFEGPSGQASLLDLFAGARQLMLQHFMFDPRGDEGCPSCTASVEELSEGYLSHLRARETAYAAVSRAPIEKIEAYRDKHGWTIPWYSSFGSDFNYDYHATIDPAVAPVEYNYRDADELRAAGMGWMVDGEHPMEQPGVSFFLRDGEAIFHTYSVYARGTEALGGAYAALDLTALGRQEEWEEPKGRADNPHESLPSFTS
jgi:predicted dithiol-disulfide oxidoreductase (DUF899 family)